MRSQWRVHGRGTLWLPNVLLFSQGRWQFGYVGERRLDKINLMRSHQSRLLSRTEGRVLACRKLQKKISGQELSYVRYSGRDLSHRKNTALRLEARRLRHTKQGAPRWDSSGEIFICDTLRSGGLAGRAAAETDGERLSELNRRNRNDPLPPYGREIRLGDSRPPQPARRLCKPLDSAFAGGPWRP
jgi:hypothetical protein